MCNEVGFGELPNKIYLQKGKEFFKVFQGAIIKICASINLMVILENGTVWKMQIES